jgi:uncharacterized damage-inducible protein DinB
MVNHQQLFAYDRWANNEVLQALQAAPKPPQRSARLMAHIVAAQVLWHARMFNQPNSVPVWPEWALAETIARADEMAGSWESVLAKVTPEFLAREFSYKNSKGEPWTSRFEEMLMHVAMHGTYHRGQVAADMRASGLQPVYTDFIHAVRTGILP